MTRDQTAAHNTITLGKFAKRLASAVSRFMEVSLLIYIPFWESTTVQLTLTKVYLFIKIGGSTTSLSRAKLADRWRPRRDHERTSHLDWGRTCNSGQLATHPPAQSLCISTIPAPRGIAVVGRQAIIDPTIITRIFHIPVMLWMFGHTYSSTGAEIERFFYLQNLTTSESYRARGQGSCAGEFFLFGSFYYCSVWVLSNCTSFHDRYPIVHVSLSLTGYYT